MAEQFNYTSVLAPYMRRLLALKASAGINALRTKWILKEIDDFANSMKLSDAHVTEKIVSQWRDTRIADGDRTLYAKYSVWSQLTKLMTRCGCECFIPSLPKQQKQTFTPYIFTPEQMTAIFAAADNLKLHDIRMGTTLISIPAILRLLYSTGMRVSEALSIRNRDVHIDEQFPSKFTLSVLFISSTGSLILLSLLIFLSLSLSSCLYTFVFLTASAENFTMK